MKYQIVNGLKPYRISFRQTHQPGRTIWIRYAEDIYQAEASAKKRLGTEGIHFKSFLIENLDAMGLTMD